MDDFKQQMLLLDKEFKRQKQFHEEEKARIQQSIKFHAFQSCWAEGQTKDSKTSMLTQSALKMVEATYSFIRGEESECTLPLMMNQLGIATQDRTAVLDTLFTETIGHFFDLVVFLSFSILQQMKVFFVRLK